MRVAFCDDEKREQEYFVKELHCWDPDCLPECFSDGASLLSAARQTPPFSLAFLDIYMAGEDGMEVAAKLKELSPATGIVFVTTSESHGIQAIGMDALHYLVKPVTAEGIAECFRRLEVRRKGPRPTLTVKADRGSYTVLLDEICYIQSVSRMTELVLSDGRTVRTWTTLAEVEENLHRRSGSFLKLNRSVVVNMDYVEQMGVDRCVMRGGVRLDLTRRSRAAIRAAYDDYVFGRLPGGGNGKEEK